MPSPESDKLRPSRRNLPQREVVKINIERAGLSDVDELLQLYFTVYGADYPLALGTDRQTMIQLISHPNHLWLVAREEKKHTLAASMVFECDPLHRIGRVEGMVVHPDFRGHHMAQRMLSFGSDRLLKEQNEIDSLYATTRTLSISPQAVFLKGGFLPLGIFPNAHKLAEYETLTFMVKYREGVLNERRSIREVPAPLGPLVALVHAQLQDTTTPLLLPLERAESLGEELKFELVYAPHHVKKLFHERFKDPYDCFYPFHEPNFLMTSINGEVELFAHLSQRDGYCTIIALSEPCWQLAGRMRSLLHSLRSFGVSYLEILIDVDLHRSIGALYGAQFLPSAMYPAMYKQGGVTKDMVLMTRTMEPLDFRGISLEQSFKPYVDQYIDLWRKMHLDIFEVVDVDD